ncbi:RecX family transcriptional regulator [Tissierella sp. MSJ-40]|uniref:Regulatory protein RecX n=1 Tax=Tissierella simiarum TaxID=2841534 RepID=A0ABS6E3D6_9FIRM|nr:RecX family transcriptional regulator [Tissierella simiarum]MBU5437420.1 RecX family transcriptional regulator [Tissierella simiarum]
MKITNIEPQKNKDRVNIFIDNKFAFGISEEIRYKYGLSLDMEVDENFIENVIKGEELNRVINYALSLLSYRQRSKKEIFERLRQKGFEEEYISQAIDYSIKQGYLNDKAFAESFIKDKINLNKYGPNRIKYDLISKGISQDIIEEVLEIDKDEEYERALELAMKKFPSYKGQDKNSIYRKLGGFLQRKGYSYDIISKVLKEILKD